MDIKEIRRIVELMERYDLAKFEIEEEGFKLGISREKGECRPAAPAPAPYAPANPQAPAQSKEEKSLYVKSPMVGTFYRAASPDSPSYVEPGSAVEPDTVVCIIEAMKVMNEIKAEVKGKIVEILAENGATVEYGQSLFRLVP